MSIIVMITEPGVVWFAGNKFSYLRSDSEVYEMVVNRLSEPSEIQ
jgi:hypothetical protein